MLQSRLLGRAFAFCLVLSAIGSCRTSAAPKGDQTASAIKPPLVVAEPPLDASRSKWIMKNWELQKAALAKAGLVAVPLGAWQPHSPRNNSRTPWRSFGPEDVCKLLENLPGAPPRLILNPSGQFVVSADGKLHCLVVDYQALGKKKETLAGTPRDCGGGAFRETEIDYHLYIVPEGVTVDEARTVRVPYYDLDISYKERCSPVP